MIQQDKPNPNRRPRSTSSSGARPRVTTASAWKQKTAGGTPLVVPSGNTCLVQASGLQVFLREGLIPNSLMPIISEAMRKGRAPQNSDFDLENNPEMLDQILDLMDSVTMYCVIEPKIEPAPRDEEGALIPFSERDPETLYVDEVDFQDKTFIFQYAVGGTADLEKFRQELGEHVETVSGS